MQSMIDDKWLVRSLAALQLFIGLGAIGGGLALVLDPSGGGLGLPLEILQASPFSNYLVPGLFLLFVNGVGSVAGSMATFRRHPWAGEMAVVLGAVLMVWILVQVWWIQGLHWLHPFYFALGAVESALGLRLRRYELPC